MTAWSVRYDSVDALQANAPAEPLTADVNAEQLAAARSRAQRAIGAGYVQGDVAVTIVSDDAGVVSVALSPVAYELTAAGRNALDTAEA